MTRLLMTCDAVGGVWHYASELAAALLPHGVDTVLAVLGPAPATRAVPPGVTVIETGLPLDWLASGPDQVIAAGEEVARLADRCGAALIQLNAPALAARTTFSVPTIAVAHGCPGTWWRAARGCPPDAGYAWHGELMRDGLLRADIAAAPSASFAAALQSAYDLPRLPEVVHNGRSPTALPQSGAEPVAAALTVGRLWDEVKNAALLDAVAAMLPVPLRAAGATVAPHGERFEPRRLTLLGAIEDARLAEEYAGRPIFVSAARFEPFGLAVLEAAMAGCPLVLSDIGTFRELWMGAALLVPEETPGAYRDAIVRVLEDEGLRIHLGQAARQRAQRYSADAMAAGMMRLYASLLAGEARVAA